MTDFLTIVLDTTAPSVTFGAAGGTTAGEFFEIAYATDEPLARATLIDAAGQRIALNVGEATLSAPLPPGTADGWATIEWADDVGNADRATAAIHLTGAVVQPPQQPLPSPPPPLRPDKRPMIRRRLTARSTIIITSRERRSERHRRVASQQLVTAVVTSRMRARGAPEAHGLTIASRSALRVRATGHVTAAVATETAVRRRDDPTIEAFLLDLL